MSTRSFVLLVLAIAGLILLVALSSAGSELRVPDTTGPSADGVRLFIKTLGL